MLSSGILITHGQIRLTSVGLVVISIAAMAYFGGMQELRVFGYGELGADVNSEYQPVPRGDGDRE